ncbi:MAG: protein kinase [Chloroflexota bacterium]
MDLDSGRILNNRYRIVRKLGQGGFGAIYRAWDLNLKAPCAVKINTEISEEAARQFALEASMLANLNHAHLPKVTDYFTIQGMGQYLVMEYIDGEDLQEKLDHANLPGEPGHLAEAQILEWMGQVCDALKYLHSRTKPIIHRDVKPANIRITSEGRAVLVDFGIAKTFTPNMATAAAAKAVTPGFSPPEQYSGTGTDSRSDIYALGATMYALLTGEVPVESVLRVAGQADLTPPSELNPEVSTQVEAAILKAMAVQAQNRYLTVDAFWTALSTTPARRPEAVTQVSLPAVATQVVQPGTREVSYGSSEVVSEVRQQPPRRSSIPWLLIAGLGLGGGGLLVVVLLVAAMLGNRGDVTNLRATQTALQRMFVTSAPATQRIETRPTATSPVLPTPQPAVNASATPVPTRVPTQPPPTATRVEPSPTSPPVQGTVKVQIRNRTGGDANLYRIGSSGNRNFLGWLSNGFYGIYTFPSLGSWTIEYCQRDAQGNDANCRQKDIDVSESGQEFAVP